MFNRILSVVVFASLCVSSACVAADDTDYRTKLAQAVRNATNRVLPSVVGIEIVGGMGAANGEVEQDAPTSGVIVDDSGYIIASSIVVKRTSASILVVLPDETRHAATVVARDNHRDLVLLKIKTKTPLVAIDFPQKLQMQVGQTTVAVGRYGTDASPMVSSGVLSATGRLDGIALQTDARVSPALYGGPLIDLYGNCLGILIPAVAKGGAPDATSWYDSGIAFAIPMDILEKKLDRMKAGDDINRGLAGIVPKSDDPIKAGTALAAVRNRSPAEKAGLKPGDTIVMIAGEKVRRFQQIRQALGSYDAGEVISMKYRRDGKLTKIKLTLAEKIPPLKPQRLGILARDMPVESDSEDEDTDKGKNNEDEASDKTDEATQVLITDVIPGSPADASLDAGDVILKIDGTEVADVQSMRRLLISAQAGVAMKFVLRRDEQQKEVTVTPTNTAGPFDADVPASWATKSDKEWQVSALKLPDVENAAAFVAPPEGTTDVDRLGLLVLLLSPGQGKPKTALETWPNMARDHGVVVCAIAPAGNERWKPNEIDIVSRFAVSVLTKAPIDPAAVAVAAAGALDGGKPTAADSMALAVAISSSETFNGVAISEKAKPPAIRLRENQADESLQIMLPIKTEDDMPTWGTALQSAGYPIVLGDATDGPGLLKWVRLLQGI